VVGTVKLMGGIVLLAVLLGCLFAWRRSRRRPLPGGHVVFRRPLVGWNVVALVSLAALVLSSLWTVIWIFVQVFGRWR